MNAIETLVGWLPIPLQAPARRLIHLLWMRPDLRYLYATLLRLRGLLTDHPHAFPRILQEDLEGPTIDLILEGLRRLHSSATSETDRERRKILEDIFADPRADERLHPGKSPNASRASDHPLQTALLTTRGDQDPLRPAHDMITARYTGRAMDNHRALTDWEWYVCAIERRETAEKKSLRHASSERNAMLAIRTLQKPGTPASIVREIGCLKRVADIQRLRLAIVGSDLPANSSDRLRYLQSFLAERHRRMGDKDDDGEDEYSRPDDDSQTTPVRRAPEFHSTTPDAPATHLTTGLAAISPPEPEPDAEAIEQIAPTPDDDIEQQAIDHDLPVESLRPSPRLYMATLSPVDTERAQDEAAIAVLTHNQMMLVRRQNQLQRSTDYVPLDTRRNAIAALRAIGAQEADTMTVDLPVASAAGIFLAAIATGRSPDRLAEGALQVIERADNLDESRQGVAYVLETSTWMIRVRLPNTKAQPVAGARPVHNWLAVPDLLEGGAIMRHFAEDASQGRHAHLDLAMRRVSQQLRQSVGIQGNQVWQWLPRALLERDGNYATLAQLTDAEILNSSVDLHYLTVSRRGAILRYLAGMRQLLGEAYLTHEAADRLLTNEAAGFIGLPTTPHWGTVMAVVKALAVTSCRQDLSPQERHNAYTLYTIFMITFALGRRHAIDVDVRMQWVGETPIAYFHEKGAHRLLVIPDRLQRQLEYYQRHRAIVASWSSLKPGLQALNNPEFFLISPDGPELFRPMRFGEGVRGFGADFQLPLNSLRRLAYSELIDAGLRGIVLDAYMGHAAYAREPLVAGSALRIGALAEVAEELNICLQRHDWEPLRGPFDA